MEPEADTRLKKGYQRLSEYMAWDPTQAIFCRFRAANLFTLLLFQAEIAELEEDLANAITEDNRSTDADERRYCKDWAALRKLGQNSVQWQKAMALREKIAVYSKSKPRHPKRIRLTIIYRGLKTKP